MYGLSEDAFKGFSRRQKWLVLIARALPFIAFLVSAYLSWIALQESGAYGCGGGDSAFDCDTVLSSRWGKWLGLPVAPFGLLTYSSISGLYWLIGNNSPSIPIRWRSVLLGLVVLAAGSGIWFAFLQFFVLKHLCPFCLAVHASGIGLAALWPWLGTPSNCQSYLSTYQQDIRTPPGLKLPASHKEVILIGCFPLILLIGGQLLFPSKSYIELETRQMANVTLDEQAVETRSGNRTMGSSTADAVDAGIAVPVGKRDDKPGTTDVVQERDAECTGPVGRVLRFFDGHVNISTLEHPYLGDPEAPAIIVELADYTCEKCRRLHAVFRKGELRYGKRLGMVVLPCPMSKVCNKHVDHELLAHRSACELSRIAIAIWMIRPEEFSKFHNWLMSSDESRTVAEAMHAALQVAKSDQLQHALNSQELDQRLARYTSLYGEFKKLNSQIGLPIQLIGSFHVSGMPDNEREVLQFWEKNLPLK